MLREALREEGLRCGDSSTQIVPLVIGDPNDAMKTCERALERGVFAQAIRPPTVPRGTSRLRLAAMASHTAAELRAAAGVLARAMPGRADEQPTDELPALQLAPDGELRPRIYDGMAEAA